MPFSFQIHQRNITFVYFVYDNKTKHRTDCIQEPKCRLLIRYLVTAVERRIKFLQALCTASINEQKSVSSVRKVSMIYGGLLTSCSPIASVHFCCRIIRLCSHHWRILDYLYGGESLNRVTWLRGERDHRNILHILSSV